MLRQTLNDFTQDDYKEDSIGSAGSLANRSNKSHERQGQEIWEEDEDDLSGMSDLSRVMTLMIIEPEVVSFWKLLIIYDIFVDQIHLMLRTTRASTCSWQLTGWRTGPPSWSGRRSTWTP